MHISRRGRLTCNPNEYHPLPGTAKRQKGVPAIGKPLVAVSPPTQTEEHPPTFAEQAAAWGGTVGLYDLPKPPHIYYFNPALVEYMGRRWLIARRTFFDYDGTKAFNWADYRSTISVFEEQNHNLVGEFDLPWPKRHHLEQTEDPRASIINGRLNLSLCCWKTPVPGQKWVVHQSLAELEDWKVSRIIDMEYGGNGRSLLEGRAYEKNWLWFEHNGHRYCVYHAQPMTVLREEDGRVVEEHRIGADLGWDYGEIRGGTPPVRVGDEYWTFFHSSQPWKKIPPVGMRNRYFAGIVAFESRPPFRITRITRQPLLVGTYREPYIRFAPPCIFPSGALLKDNRWTVVYGVNDTTSGWLEVDHQNLEPLLTPVSYS